MRDETKKEPQDLLEIPGDELMAFALGVLYYKTENGEPDFNGEPPLIKLNVHLAKMQSHSYELTLSELIGLNEAILKILMEIGKRKQEADSKK